MLLKSAGKQKHTIKTACLIPFILTYFQMFNYPYLMKHENSDLISQQRL